MLSYFADGLRKLLGTSNGVTISDVFSNIYRLHRWGEHSQLRFFSGSGSHDASVVEPCMAAVSQFIRDFDVPPQVADLGCGDFTFGSQIRQYCGVYIACDVVPELIRYNRMRFAALDVEFRCTNIVDEPLPPADVALLKQILQHLNNEQIGRITQKLRAYRHLICVEHIPECAEFPRNLDHVTGAGIRLSKGSGVVLTAPPFNLKVRSERELCRVKEGDGVVLTVAYELM